MTGLYRLYAGDVYYPLGGGDDFIRSFDTLVEATDVGQELVTHADSGFGWFNVSFNNEIVAQGRTE